ncbi:MAG: zinc ribbon domain-containing protein [Candidatus Scalinduaceae bacterium]
MPIYEYSCEGCNYRFEDLASISDSSKKMVECPKCKEKFAHKIPSRFSVNKSVNQKKPLKTDNKENLNERRAAINIGNAGNVKLDNLLVKGGHVANVYGNANVKIKNCKRIP